MLHPGLRRCVLALTALLALWLGLFAVDYLAFGARGEVPGALPNFEDVLAGIATGLVLLRAIIVAAERGVWLLVGLGLAAWVFGDVLWTLDYNHDDHVPSPNVADAGYLLFPVLMAPAIAGLWRSRTQRTSRALSVDGVAAGLTVASLSAMLSLDAVLGAAQGRALEVLTLVAYPATDLIMLAAVVWALAARGWALDRGLAGIGLAVACFWLADTMYLVAMANEAYVVGTWYDPFWYLAFVLLAWAAWQPAGAPAVPGETARALVMPIVFAAGALALLFAGRLGDTHLIAFALAGAALMAVNVRLVLTFAQNVRMLRHSRHEALTDALTGLGNRRALISALQAAARRAGPAHAVTLAIYDLDGFKLYNDTFGHPAGDALLTRLGERLAACVDGRGEAFRMGGDEFCVLHEGSEADGLGLTAAAAAALSERGDGFYVSASHGLAVLPRDARDQAEALRIADRHLYSVKAGRRSSAGRQTMDALLRVLAERSPDIAAHTEAVAAHADAVAGALDLDDDEHEAVRHAAELHDIGKIAVPDPILLKRGPLDAEEWEFVRRHPSIGERIVGAAPALARAARIVRSSHERWDGGGYPDGLTGEEIPLGARIVAVCDAYDAIISERPYSAARTPAAAVAELRRCAGSQFDPLVVEAFCSAVAAGRPSVVA